MQEIITAFSSSSFSIRTLLSSSLGRHQSKPVSLFLPRFTLKLHHDLIPSLTTLGLGPAFESSPDFTPISNTGPLLISSAIHDVFIEVNEEGTEIAAVTVVTMRKKRAETIEMRVNRPFLFLIFDGRTGLVLCSAVVSQVSDGSAK
jgi:serpin B